MSLVDTPPPRMSARAFIAWEEQRDERWELFDGVPRMMTGGRVRNGVVASTVNRVLGTALSRSRPDCSMLAEGAKVVVPNGDVYYPDMLIACGALDPRATTLSNPAVVVEILSPSTERRDRGRKWIGYRELASLTHYLLVDPFPLAVDVFERRGEEWIYSRLAGPEARLDLAGLAVSLSLGELFEGLDPLVDEDDSPPGR